MSIIDEFFQSFYEHKKMTYGECVTLCEHMLQSAVLADLAGEDDWMVAAALLHDYGHFVHGLDENIADHGIDGRHEHVGAERLEPYFIPEVVEPIRFHVAAKRYLCTVNPKYLVGLSDASAKSLALQGGPFTQNEARAFEEHPHFERVMKLRRFDEAAKIKRMDTPPVESYRTVLESALLSQIEQDSGQHNDDVHG